MMNGIMHILFVGVGIIILAMIRSFIEDKSNGSNKIEKMESNMEENNKMLITTEGVQVEIGTRDLLMQVLMEIGCLYTVDENLRICFHYQGEHLVAEANNDCNFINVFDTFWENCELSDVEGVARLKRAINTVNLNETVTIFYTINEEDNTLWVHCKKNFLFIPQIPDVGNYLKSMFAALFQAHHALGAELERLKNNKN